MTLEEKVRQLRESYCGNPSDQDLSLWVLSFKKKIESKA